MELHLRARGLEKERYFSSDLYVGETEVYFYLWNLSGQLSGYQKYNPNNPKTGGRPREQKYFTYLPKQGRSPTLAVWGLSQLNPNDRTLFVVEGVFDAVKLHSQGLNALALLSNNPLHLKSWLWSLGYNVVAVCDGDHAGKSLTKLSTRESVFLPEGKDLGDLEDGEVREFLKNHLLLS